MTALPPAPLYPDRASAGKAVARALESLRGRGDLLVLGLPRGGVPVARVVADALDAPLDVIIARKLGVPGLEEVALGAIAEGSRVVVEDSVRWFIGVPQRVMRPILTGEREELERRTRLYRDGRPLPDVRGRTVVLVDDGLASGATLRAAALAVRRRKPARLVAAVPVASPLHCDEVRPAVDELVALATPDPFETVSAWYEDFAPVSDAEVRRLLGRDLHGQRLALAAAPDPEAERTVVVPIADGAARLIGELGIPNATPAGLVVLAHGGGSSRNSYRNRYLAGRLRGAGWATLRIDLLLEHEQAADAVTGDARFDVPRIADRLIAAVDWAVRERVPGGDCLVLFGASTGAAAALVAAARRPTLVAGVASRGGRVDLAGDAWREVRAPAILIVGAADTDTLRSSRAVVPRLGGATRLTVIRGAGHTFDEPGALGAVGEHVVGWLEGLSRRRRRTHLLTSFAAVFR